jgi:hypothetical protein
MPQKQSTPRKDSARGASVARRLIAASTIDPRILDTTIFVPGLAGETDEVKYLRAGHSYVVNGLQINRGDMTVLVQSSAASGRWFVCHNHQWSTKDERIVAKLRKLVLAFAA